MKPKTLVATPFENGVQASKNPISVSSITSIGSNCSSDRSWDLDFDFDFDLLGFEVSKSRSPLSTHCYGI